MKMRLKILLGLFVYSMTIAVVLAAGAFWWLSHEFTRPGPAQEPVFVVVESGSGLGTITGTLKESGVITRADIFKLSARLLKASSDLKAGEYEIPPGASMKDVLALLREGKTYRRAVTVREGLTSYEIVRLLNGVDSLSGEIMAMPAEGVLLPETYDYGREENRNALLLRLHHAMLSTLIELCKIYEGEKEKLADEATVETGDEKSAESSQNTGAFWIRRQADSAPSGLMTRPCGSEPLKTVKDVLTLASIVEKETGKPEERARVAGVFLNRLKRGIPLQTDPTVIYALTGGKHDDAGKGPLGRRLLRKDLEIDSPYNTYKYPGLPPGPIANPGKASIEAVIHPEEHDFLFFVADGTGGHVFAKTLAEHNRNVAQWRKIRREQAR
ncbi:MAG: endolytic transglycosylase MltG [Alphaproteobacteria bacterium]|nr:endolytic transglycosylase MltG [Alphaproteobacteria bacterium]